MYARSLLVPVLLAVAVSAHGQSIEEIIVTAQKYEQSANDVGITINVITGDQLRDMGAASADSLAPFTPGLTINDVAPTGIPVYTLRGVGFQDFSTGASSTVGLYFDEVNIPYAVMSRGLLFDVERVEVLRGPQGDLYGRNTTAGQINFISRKPTGELEGGVEASYGSYSTFDVEGFVSGPLTDGIRARLAARATKSNEGWQKSLTRDDELGEVDVMGLRSIVSFDIGDRAKLDLNLHYVKDESENPAPQAINGLDIGTGTPANLPHLPLQEYTDDFVTLNSIPPWFAPDDAEKADWSNSYTSTITGTTWDLRPKRDNELAGVSAKLVWEFADLQLTSLTAYDEFERAEVFDGDGGAFLDTSNINTTAIDVFSQELRLSGSSDKLLWIAGLYYSEDDLDEDYHFFMPDSLFGDASVVLGIDPFQLAPIYELDTSYLQESDSQAIFGHVEYALNEQWRLTVGARYTEEDRSWSGCTFSDEDNSLGNFLNTLFGSTLQAGDCGIIDDIETSPTYIFNLLGTPDVNDAFHVASHTVSTDRWMGKIGVDFRPSDDVLTYLTVSHGFKSGGFNGAPLNTTSQTLPYGPEKLTAYELGMKLTLLDDAMQLNAATFYYDYKDKQEADVAVTLVGAISGLTNVPKSRIYGAEVEMQWTPVAELNVEAGLAYLETEVIEWQATDPASVWPEVLTFDASGIELAQAPKWSGRGLISYGWPVGGDHHLRVAADVNYKDSTTGGANAFAFATEPYTLYNARISFEDDGGRWYAQLWGRNITDEFYFHSAFVANGPYVRYVGMPRTVGLTLGYYF